jgi:predicted TIM-barrel fold metal-dependent hydrolase
MDLSMTMMKYEGSSIDQDIRFLFRSFDRRIAIGTDYPEYSLERVRARFEYFSEGLPQEKKENVAHRNLSRFLGMQ